MSGAFERVLLARPERRWVWRCVHARHFEVLYFPAAGGYEDFHRIGEHAGVAVFLPCQGGVH